MSPFWLLMALVATAAAWRWRGAGRGGRAGLALVAIACLLVGAGVIELPSLEEIVQEIGSRLGKWTYLLVGVNAFLETGAFLGFIAPGETMVLFGGVLAGEGTIELVPLIAIVWICAYLGDISAYLIGRRYGRDFLLRHGERVKIGEPQVQFVERFFERHGHATVILGRWVGVVRPLVPFLAGSSRLPAVRFLAVDFVAAGLWSVGLCVLGAAFWRNFDELTALVGQALFVFATVVIGGAVVAAAVAVRRSPERNRVVEDWIAEQVDGGRVAGRPAAASWAIVKRIEPRIPGRRAAAQPPATTATVPDDDAAPAGLSSRDRSAE